MSLKIEGILGGFPQHHFTLAINDPWTSWFDRLNSLSFNAKRSGHSKNRFLFGLECLSAPIQMPFETKRSDEEKPEASLAPTRDPPLPSGLRNE
jgi:hypothetical protein